jgi:predicted DNA-binding transcriptional regulator AlpA
MTSAEMASDKSGNERPARVRVGIDFFFWMSSSVDSFMAKAISKCSEVEEWIEKTLAERTKA